MILAAILWGTGNVALQTVLVHVGPFTAVGLRCLIAALVFIPVLRTTSRLNGLVAKPARLSAIAASISFCVAVTLSQIGYGLTSVTNAGFFINTTTVITPVLAWVLLKQRPHVIVWLAALLILAGAMLMSGGSLHGVRPGDAICLASAVAYAFWMIHVGEYARKGGDASALTLLQFSFTAAITLPLGLTFEQVTLARLAAALPELLFLGLFATAGAYYIQIVAQNHTSASEAAIIGSGEAVVGAIAAYFLLDELLTATSASGAVLVSAGIVLVQRPAWIADWLRGRPQEDMRSLSFHGSAASRPVPVPSRRVKPSYTRRTE